MGDGAVTFPVLGKVELAPPCTRKRAALQPCPLYRYLLRPTAPGGLVAGGRAGSGSGGGGSGGGGSGGGGSGGGRKGRGKRVVGGAVKEGRVAGAPIEVKWNFAKILVVNGHPRRSYRPTMMPLQLEGDIERALQECKEQREGEQREGGQREGVCEEQKTVVVVHVAAAAGPLPPSAKCG